MGYVIIDKIMEEIKTSDEKWLEKALKAYSIKQQFSIDDDGQVGLKETDVKSAVALISFAKKGHHVSWRKISQILASLGITGVGVWIIAAAIADPEPTSKLSLLVAGGLVLALTGSLGTLASLGLKFHVSARRGGTEFHIKPQ
jgi:hypothetical protein